MTDKLNRKQSITLPNWFEPAKRPRFNRGNIQDAQTAAVRAAAAHGKPFYVFGTHGGCQVSSEKPSLPSGYTYYKYTVKGSTATAEEFETG